MFGGFLEVGDIRDVRRAEKLKNILALGGGFGVYMGENRPVQELADS